MHKLSIMVFILNLLFIYPASASDLDIINSLFQTKNIGANISYVEKMIGPALYSQEGIQSYEVGNCSIDIYGEQTIESIMLKNISPQCSFDLDNFLNIGSVIPVHSLTFGKFDSIAGGDSVYTSDCIKMCGNAYDPVVYDTFEGPRSMGFMTFQSSVALVNDDAISAASRWADIMGEREGETWVISGGYNTDTKYNSVAQTLFRNVKINSIRIGSF